MNLSRMPGIPTIQYPDSTTSTGFDLSTWASLAVCVALFALGLWIILKATSEQESKWNDDQWRYWWDSPMLPNEPDPDGGLDLPKDEESELVEAVAGSSRVGGA